MAIIIETQAPRRLLRQIRTAIDEGTIPTWSCDVDGDLCLTTEAMKGEAWMRAKDGDERLIFNIVGKDGRPMTKLVYATYHSRLVHMCLTYFDESCRTIRVTPLPTSSDLV